MQDRKLIEMDGIYLTILSKEKENWKKKIVIW